MESDRWAGDSTETSERCAGLNFSGRDLTYRTVVWQIFSDFLTGSVHALWLLEYWAERSLSPSLWLLARKEIVVCKEFPAAILNFWGASPSLVPDTCPPVFISILISFFFFFSSATLSVLVSLCLRALSLQHPAFGSSYLCKHPLESSQLSFHRLLCSAPGNNLALFPAVLICLFIRFSWRKSNLILLNQCRSLTIINWLVSIS